ncbi:hypothetical protein BDY19DRAFT_998617 [Irpex rosettiformis]|uniref:Uncharacterized protein n=1 Tax=Irpex rosettiformis TaxID=378272 RepID=A0ACB8TN15_9APHY|nr:hypothetical protein BDY19DRAFT_998617 [Irpex rosettiformis]
MAPLITLSTLLLVAYHVYAEIIAVHRPHQRQITDLTPHRRNVYEARDSPEGADDSLSLLDILLVASVDGKLHALNRTSGDALWSMSGSASSHSLSSDPRSTPLSPLVSTRHPLHDPTASDSDDTLETYIIEPQSGDIYVLPTPNSPLQRLPLTMSQLIELSPYSISGEDSTKVFVGRKETSLVLLELETGKIKATLNSAECPWDPFEDLSRDREDEDEDAVDLDELDGTRPRKVKSTSTEVFIGRTDYYLSIYTRPLDRSFPRPPPQNLSFSTYGPNNQDVSFQSLYTKTPDDTYVQAMANGKIMAFRSTREAEAGEGKGETKALWGHAYDEPIVATFDVLRSPSRPAPFVLLQPMLSLPSLLPNVDLTSAAKNARLPNLESAYVGMVESTGSLYVMSPDRYPLVVFGDTNNFDDPDYGVGRAAGRLIDPPPGTFNHGQSSSYPASDSDAVGDRDYDLPPSVDSITRFMKRKKLRQLCADPQVASVDRRCLVGVRKMESSRLGRLLDGAPSVPLPPSIVQPSSKHEAAVSGNTSVRPEGGMGISMVGDSSWDSGLDNTYTFGFGVVTLVLAFVLAWIWRGWRTSALPSSNGSSLLSGTLESKNGEDGTLAESKEGDGEVVKASSVEIHIPDMPPSPTSSAPPPSSLVPVPASVPPLVAALSAPSTPRQRTRKVSFGEALKVDGEDANDLNGEGDDSDNDNDVEQDVPATPGAAKKKSARRKRGKKRPKAIVVNGVHGREGGEVEGGDEQEGNGVTKGESKLVLMKSTVEPPTPTTSLVVSEDILGFGSHGTVVFKGSLQGRAVAVKRLLRDFVTLASREVSVLQESDDHPNVIRYYYQESHANFLYIALELCPASLADVIERPDQFRDIAVAFDPKKALRQIAAGLRHLHGLKIIHRDIKPQNILVSHAKQGVGHRMLISDFGLCKKLEMDQTSFYPTAHGAMAAGTVGWRAPEILRGDVSLDSANSSSGSIGGDESQSSRGSAYGSDVGTPTGRLTRLTKSVDVFALGCLYYYVLTNGGHPFGDRYERDVNILKGAKCLNGLEGFGEEGSEAVDIIGKMLSPEARERPDTSTCLLHPYFWDSGKRLSFLQETSDRLEIMCRDPRDPLLVELERGAFGVVGNDWNARLDKWFIENLGKYRKYDGKSVQDLMRALRNKKHHYQDLPDNVKRQIESMPEGFLSYFTRRFPKLFLHVHGVVASSHLRSESIFRSYFEHAE